MHYNKTWCEMAYVVLHLLKVECKELFFRDFPELDDSLADKLLPACTTLVEVKESLLQKCLELEQTAKEQAADNAILDRANCKMVEVDVPQSLFEEQRRQLYGAQLLQIQAKTKLTEQQLAYLSSPKTVNEFLENNRENINRVIRQNLAVGDIFKCGKLQFSTEELVKEVKNSIAEFKRHNQEYDEECMKEQVITMLEMQCLLALRSSIPFNIDSIIANASRIKSSELKDKSCL
ncbi:hypothetical protein ACH5RR_027843 [Cinchona calisaya]|uniref:Trigger factor C-terminal domain-containing protein n=1 Tax=Cinchona calisaya TaxID=153742 RepID=A0ABD2YRI1_9GENT